LGEWEESVLSKIGRRIRCPIRDILLGNLNLFAKWRWSLLVREQVQWKEVLEAKYDSILLGNPNLEGITPSKHASLWWRDIVSLGGGSFQNLNWFQSGERCGDVFQVG
jgi:hypothetical protein